MFGDGMIDSSSGAINHVSGSKPTGAAREHAVLERGSQSNTYSSNFVVTRDAIGLLRKLGNSYLLFYVDIWLDTQHVYRACRVRV